MIAALALAGSLLVGQTHSLAPGDEIQVRIARIEPAAACNLGVCETMADLGGSVGLSRDAMLDMIWCAGSLPGTVFFPSRILSVPALGESTAATRANTETGFVDASIRVSRRQDERARRALAPIVEISVSIADVPKRSAAEPPFAAPNGASLRLDAMPPGGGILFVVSPEGARVTHAPAPADEPAPPRSTSFFVETASRRPAAEGCYVGGPPPRGVEGSWLLDESLGMPLALDLDFLEFAGPVYLVFVTPVAK